MGPRSTTAAVVILGLTLAVNMVAGMRSPARFQRQMTALVQPAIEVCKEKSLSDRFWHELASGNVNHCVREFADQLKANFDQLDKAGDIDLVEMYEDIQFEAVEDCSDKFTRSVRDMINVVTPIEDLDYLTGAYRIDEENDEEEIAAVVADVVKLMDGEKITEVEEFKKVYRESGPCSKFYDYLNQVPDHEAYIAFLKLLTVPEYHSIAQWSHMAMVDFLVACDHVDHNDSLLRDAFRIYLSLPDIDPDEFGSESMLDTVSHDSDLDTRDEADMSLGTDSPGPSERGPGHSGPDSVEMKSHMLSESDAASMDSEARDAEKGPNQPNSSKY